VRVQQHAQKRKGEFSRETPPSLFRFSEIRFWFLITTLAIPEPFGNHELQPVPLPHSSMMTFAARAFPTAIRFQLPGPSLVADSRRPPLVRSLLLTASGVIGLIAGPSSALRSLNFE
jgi:hypothetical protein